MNYHRRTTRPDANYYRETRKTARLSRGRGRRGGISPVAVFLLIVALAAVVFFDFRH
jgi:hypothetical protein